MGFLGRIREGLARTTQQIVGRFEEIASRADAPDSRSRPLDVETLDALEELLISADVGLPATERIITAVRGRERHGESLRDLVKSELRAVFADTVRAAPNGHRPHVVLIVGVNGTGKTTTVGKLANLVEDDGRTAAHLRGRHVPRGGRRAAADLGDAGGRRHRARAATAPTRRRLSSTRSRRARRAAATPILVDTAGRLHNRANLMNGARQDPACGGAGS